MPVSVYLIWKSRNNYLKRFKLNHCTALLLKLPQSLHVTVAFIIPPLRGVIFISRILRDQCAFYVKLVFYLNIFVSSSNKNYPFCSFVKTIALVWFSNFLSLKTYLLLIQLTIICYLPINCANSNSSRWGISTAMSFQDLEFSINFENRPNYDIIVELIREWD